ncbi:2-hydroxy-3-oxopropionate reductase [Mycetocola sp. CAN_C7]|uniref:NAD(P)-dependent oxidoreductase n=1 Tax=Mycetocola sp. CAN_C7 TaxID=2787724 RepID=UPI0018CB1E7E
MTVIGFIGLGVMGRPMAANLVNAGHDVRGYARSESARAGLADLGITAVDSVAAAVAGAELVLTMLPDSPDVEAVVLGDDGVLASIEPGAGYIDMSTITPESARLVADRLREKGHAVLDAPVSGGEAGAQEGTLSIMVGGNAADLDRWRNVLSAMGGTIVHVGDSGSGQVVKAANQLMVAGHLQMLAEAIVFLEAQKTDVGTALSVIAKGLGGSTVIDRKVNGVLAENFRPGFRIELHHKDLGIVRDAARKTGTALPVTALISQFVQSLVTRGDGGLDHSALVTLAREANVGARA